jgi:hypothetical protein
MRALVGSAMEILPRCHALALCLAIAGPALAHAQDTATSHAPSSSRREIIRGQVTTDSGVPISGAEVVATRAPDRAFKSAQTSADGRYEIVWEDGTGDYLIHVAALGRKNFRQRVTRTGSDSVFVVDAKLESSVQRIATVTVEAKPKPERNADFFKPETGAAEKLADGVAGAVPPELAGDLASIAATIPGIAAVPGGISAFGLGASQNSITLNGMSFGGADIPSDVHTRIRVTTSTYDPARGWFSGVNTNVELLGGSLFSGFRGHATIDAPALQATDRISSRLGQRYSNVQAGIGGQGPIDDRDRYFYAFGAQAERRAAPSVSLLDAHPDLLQRGGVAADSVTRLLDLLEATSVPINSSQIPSSSVSDNLKILFRIDHAPYDWKSLEPAKRTWGLTGYGNIARSGLLQPVTTQLTATPTRESSGSRQLGNIEAMYSSYFGNNWLEDARTSFTASRDRQTPYVVMPAGRVLVASDFDDGAGGVTQLQFGGNSLAQVETRQWTWESTSETLFYAQNRATHRIKLNADSRLDGFAQDSPGNRLGTFAYNSLADFEANQPASFTRTLGALERSAGEWNGYAAVGDLWHVSRSVQVMYGVRVEGNAFTHAPAYNPEVDRLFSVRTDHAPNTVHVSPRLGFTWNRTGGGYGFVPGTLGTFNIGPTGVFRGGIGEFRGMLSPSLLANASALTGLPGGVRTLTCLGAAVPTPDWARFVSDPNAIPFQCLDGTPALTDSARAVQVFDRAYKAPRSWRGNLAYSATLKNFLYTVDGTYSLNLDQPGIENLNFLGNPKFMLSDEGRPVYVTAQSIVPVTGAVSPVEGRLTNSLGSVINNRSDLKSISRQLLITVTPDLTQNGGHWYLSTSYALSSVRTLARGFDGATFGNPSAREWSRGQFDVRHQISVGAGLDVRHVALTFFSVVRSGLPFTPVVGSDVNGDGFANDRAFVFDPSRSGDAAFGAQLNSLLASLPRSVRTCLTKQMGAAAGRNSCEGPWTATMNAKLSTSGYFFKLPRLTDVALNFANPLGGIDQLLHGSAHLRGWGTAASPDPFLYTVRGFDPTSSRFLYQVNPRFGSTRPSLTTLRAPFRITLTASVRLGADVAHQQLARWLRPGRGGQPGPRLSVEELKRRYARNINDPYTGILEESDSLLLSKEQSLAISNAQARFHQRLDSLWTGFATYLSELPDRYDADEAYRRQEAATDAAWVLAWQDVRETLPSILSPIQLKLLPGVAGYFVRTDKPPKGIRTYEFAGS